MGGGARGMCMLQWSVPCIVFHKLFFPNSRIQGDGSGHKTSNMLLQLDLKLRPNLEFWRYENSMYIKQFSIQIWNADLLGLIKREWLNDLTKSVVFLSSGSVPSCHHSWKIDVLLAFALHADTWSTGTHTSTLYKYIVQVQVHKVHLFECVSSAHLALNRTQQK